MKKALYLLCMLLIASFISCEKKISYPLSNKTTAPSDINSGKIFTIAGLGTQGFSGDGGQATIAELALPVGVAVDHFGNIYIADCSNCRIRKVNTNGIISTVAGNGTPNYSGDGGPATAAELKGPYGLAMDGIGNLYFADNSNNRIRKIDVIGTISTIAGNGFAGDTGNGGFATDAEIYLPNGVTVDGLGNIYIAEATDIRKVNTSGIISVFAGGGKSGLGDGAAATAAELYVPYGVSVGDNGNVYIADYQDNRIRMVDTNGIISTIAGNGYGAPFGGGAYFGDGGPASAAELYEPTDVLVDGSNNVYIFDASNYRVRIVNSSGIISTIVGNGDNGCSGDSGSATAAKIGYGQGMTLDGSGNLYISDLYFNRVRVVYK